MLESAAASDDMLLMEALFAVVELIVNLAVMSLEAADALYQFFSQSREK